MDKNRRGMSLIELVFSLLIGVIVITISFGGWIFMMYGYHKNTAQQELDIDARMAMENLKKDIRLTSMDNIIFYPMGKGPYTALSFPKARDDDGDGMIDLDSENRIIWDETVIYHVYKGSPNELRRTVIDPRNPDLSTTERFKQLVQIVENGSGSSADSTTTTLFKNLFALEIKGKNAVFDAYGAKVGRFTEVVGSVVLNPGSHEITLKAVDKNPSSSDYKLDLDNLAVTPSRSIMEGEILPVVEVNGAPYEHIYMDGGSWSANCQLRFNGNSVNDSISMSFNSDSWTETIFIGHGSTFDDAVAQFNEQMDPPTYYLMLPGKEYNWWSHEQTGNTNPAMQFTEANARGDAIRVLMKGGNLGGHIGSDGGNPWILVRAPQNQKMEIYGAYIAESASTYNQPSPDTVGRRVQLRFAKQDGTTQTIINPGSTQWLVPEDGKNIEIDRNKTYAVTLLIADSPTTGYAMYNKNPNIDAVESYRIPGSEEPGLETIKKSNWSSIPNVEASPKLFAIESVYAQKKQVGYYTSAVFNTRTKDPFYNEISCTHENESGTTTKFKVRSGDQPDLSDAPSWNSIAWQEAPSSLDIGKGQYVQFQVALETSNMGWSTPKLKTVTIDWKGEQKLSDVALTYTTGPDNGIYEVEIDGNPILKGLTASIEIYKEVPALGGGLTKVTSVITQEIEPRNSDF